MHNYVIKCKINEVQHSIMYTCRIHYSENWLCPHKDDFILKPTMTAHVHKIGK